MVVAILKLIQSPLKRERAKNKEIAKKTNQILELKYLELSLLYSSSICVEIYFSI